MQMFLFGSSLQARIKTEKKQSSNQYSGNERGNRRSKWRIIHEGIRTRPNVWRSLCWYQHSCAIPESFEFVCKKRRDKRIRDSKSLLFGDWAIFGKKTTFIKLIKQSCRLKTVFWLQLKKQSVLRFKKSTKKLWTSFTKNSINKYCIKLYNTVISYY